MRISTSLIAAVLIAFGLEGAAQAETEQVAATPLVATPIVGGVDMPIRSMARSIRNSIPTASTAGW
jgi:hypothetical protein